MPRPQSRGGSAWYDWEPDLVTRDPRALARERTALADSIRYYQFVQYVFAAQWGAVREARPLAG